MLQGERMLSGVEESTRVVSPPTASTGAMPIIYIMSRFPKLTETFILREML